MRRGEASIAPHETLSEDATLVFGVIYSSFEDHRGWMEEISEFTGLPTRFLHYDPEESRIEMPISVAEEISEDVEAPVAVIEVTPTFDRTEVSLVWLNELRP